MKESQINELTFHELEDINGGSLAIAAGICFILGFATGCVILYYANK